MLSVAASAVTQEGRGSVGATGPSGGPRSRLVTTSNWTGRATGRAGPPQPRGHGLASFNDSLFSIRLLCTDVNAISDKLSPHHLGRAVMGI